MRHFLRVTGCMVFLSLFLALPAWGVGEIFTVKSRQAQLRQSPTFTGSVSATLAYGTHVEVTEERGSWLKVLSETRATGWMHTSSLSAGRLQLKAGERASSGASGVDVTGSGKGLERRAATGASQTVGFNEGVENTYRKTASGNYARVNAMARTGQNPKALLDFLAAGGVTPATEGAR